MARYLDLGAVIDRLRRYYANGEVIDWLYASHPQLGVPPITLIREGRAAEVHAVLDRLDAGAYL